MPDTNVTHLFMQPHDMLWSERDLMIVAVLLDIMTQEGWSLEQLIDVASRRQCRIAASIFRRAYMEADEAEHIRGLLECARRMDQAARQQGKVAWRPYEMASPA